MSTPPVLLLIYARPETTLRVVEAIRGASPPRLYIAADGPRSDLDRQACLDAREVVMSADWGCEVHTLFRETNLGLRQAVSTGIDWFFDNEVEGVILEDDCLPDPTFFRFCSELLDRYRDDDRVMAISGDDFHPDHWNRRYAYSFTRYPFVWGWATWRRAWRLYDSEMASWPPLDRSWLRALGAWHARQYWADVLDQTAIGRIDTWDYVWTMSMMARQGMAIMPTSNLVSNIGSGPGATHTKVRDWRMGKPLEQVSFPLRHPPDVRIDARLHSWLNVHVYRTRARSIRNRLLRSRLGRAALRAASRASSLVRPNRREGR